MRASTAELTERLAVRTEENTKLNLVLSDTKRELEMAQVHVEQVSYVFCVLKSKYLMSARVQTAVVCTEFYFNALIFTFSILSMYFLCPKLFS